MARTIRLLFVFICISYTVAAQDFVLMRNGDKISCKILQVDDESTQIKVKGSGLFGGGGNEESLATKDIYMLHYQKRGNVYVAPDGKRTSGENHVISKDADIIYLVSGGEKAAYNIQFEDNLVKYRETKEAKKAKTNERLLMVDEIFMILYSDGSKDLLTDISQPVSSKAVEDTVKIQKHEPVDTVPKLQVVFHNVKRGDTIDIIAGQYDVSVDDLIKWNDLATKNKKKIILQPDMQLMIYVPEIK